MTSNTETPIKQFEKLIDEKSPVNLIYSPRSKSAKPANTPLINDLPIIPS